MGRMVKCAHCAQTVDKDNTIRYNDKNYHPSCYQIAKERNELIEYICKVLDLKSAGPRNYALIKKYITEGYTYKNMLLALKYFYEVKKNNTDKSNGSIGIIPWVYEEAINYYKTIASKQENLVKSIEKIEKEPTKLLTVTVQQQKTNKRTEIDLTELFEINDA